VCNLVLEQRFLVGGHCPAANEKVGQHLTADLPTTMSQIMSRGREVVSQLTVENLAIFSDLRIVSPPSAKSASCAPGASWSLSEFVAGGS
jgi:hypothetical protein